MIKPNVTTRVITTITGEQVTVIEQAEPSRRRRKRYSAHATMPSYTQLREAEQAGWQAFCYEPGHGYTARENVEHLFDYTFTLLKRTVRLEDAVYESSKPTPQSAKTGRKSVKNVQLLQQDGVVNTLNDPEELQELHTPERTETAGQTANTCLIQGVVSNPRLGLPNLGNDTDTTSPAVAALPPLPALVRADAAEVIARLSGGFGIEALDMMRGGEYQGPHVEIGYDTEYYEDEQGGRHILSYQFAVLDRDDDGSDVLREWVVLPLWGWRLTRDAALAPVIHDLSRSYAYADYQCWWVHLPDEEGELKLTSVHAPRAVYNDKESVLLRIKALFDLCERIPEEERDALLAPTPVPANCPSWMSPRSRYFVPESICCRDEDELYTYRGLVRADSLYDEDTLDGEYTDEQKKAIRAGRRYRDVFAGTHLSGCSVGYTNDYTDVGRDPAGERYPDWKLDVTLISHFGSPDRTAFDSSEREKDLMPRLSKVQGGLVTLTPMAVQVSRDTDFTCFQQVLLEVRDTMCYAPAGKKTLAALGDAIGVPKIEVPKEWKEHMDLLMLSSFGLFLEYGINDAVIALLYAKSLFGRDNELPVTANSAAARVARASIERYLGVSSKAEFDERYRGLTRVKQGGTAYGPDGMVPFTTLAPLSTDAATVLNMSSVAYKGGLNASTLIGYYPELTRDVDAQNAYPTAMMQVVDIDWSRPILADIRDRDLTWDDFDGALGPSTPLLCEIEFEFPAGTYQPCIPITCDTALTFPLTSEGAACVVASGPEQWLALKLGARVRVKHGVRLRPLRRDDGSFSMCLSEVVRVFVQSRSDAKALFGSGSLAELLAKLGINGNYGKVAQGVSLKKTFNAFKGVMEDLEGSIITSPYHACMITALVRALLAAAMNELHARDRCVYSVTTDGFITDATLEELEVLDLYGIARTFHAARLAVTDGEDPTIWALKHAQDDLLNFSTRGNVSLHVGGDYSVLDGLPGVCAHNSLVTGYEKNGYEDRRALMVAVLSRTGRVETHKARPTGFRELSSRSERADFHFRDQRRDLSMDFDMKRRPLRRTMHDVTATVEGVSYVIANFESEPWHDVNEYMRAKGIARRISSDNGCLRTRGDWLRFFLALDKEGGSIAAKDPAWALVKAAVGLYRMGRRDIPPLRALNDGSDGSIDRCVSWVNRFVPKTSKHYRKFTRDTWKNVQRRNRNVVIPEDLLDEVFDAMCANDPAPWVALFESGAV